MLSIRTTVGRIAARIDRASRGNLTRLLGTLGLVTESAKARAVRAATRVPGVVEVFTMTEIVGWVAAEPGSGPLRVSLRVNNLVVASTWATDPIKRNGPGEVRGFRLPLRELWQFCKKSDRLAVYVAGKPLAIVGHGMWNNPGRNGPHSVNELRARLDAGHVFSDYGRLQLSKQLDLGWQRAVLALYQRVRGLLRDTYGYDCFLCYGALLGQVGDDDFIGHDHDFDAAYISKHTTGADVVNELYELSLVLIDAGFDVYLGYTCLHVGDFEGGAQVDLFHLYFDEDGTLAFPWGVAGRTQIHRAEWTGTVEVTFAGHTVAIPADAERFVEHMYGPQWRTPNPGFNWRQHRTARAMDGAVPHKAMDPVNWENYYAHRCWAAPSSFCRAILSGVEFPDTVVDLGCGDGRDSYAFAAAGKTVVGVDRSARAIATATARSAGLDRAPRFQVGDLADSDMLRELIAGAHADGPIAVYLRFVLHATEPETEARILDALRDGLRPGDYVAVEFRTTSDARDAVSTGRLNRLIDSAEFGTRVRELLNCAVVDERQGRGVCTDDGNDPHVYRLIGRVSSVGAHV